MAEHMGMSYFLSLWPYVTFIYSGIYEIPFGACPYQISMIKAAWITYEDG